MPLEKHDPLLRWFRSDHLRPALRGVVNKYSMLATMMVMETPHSEERTIALRKLIESKDAAVRALILHFDQAGWPDEPGT